MALQLLNARITVTGEDDGEEINNVFDYNIVYEDTEGSVFDVLEQTADGWEGIVLNDYVPATINNVLFTKVTIDDLNPTTQYQVVRPIGVNGLDGNERLPKGNCLYIAKKSLSRDRTKNGGVYLFPPSIAKNGIEGKPEATYVDEWMQILEAIRSFEGTVGLVRASNMVIRSQKTGLATDVQSFVPKTDTWAFLKSRSGRAKRTKPAIVP